MKHQMFRWCVLVGAIVVLALMTSTAAAQKPGTTTLYGTVIDNGGQELEGIKVTLSVVKSETNDEQEQTVYTQYTDENGIFRFKSVPVSTDTEAILSVEADGYQNYAQPHMLQPDKEEDTAPVKLIPTVSKSIGNTGAVIGLVVALVIIILGSTGLGFDLKSSGDPIRYSKSKIQVFAWTCVTIAAFGAVFGARLALSLHDTQVELSLPNVPQNLLILMGLSATTAVGAKGIVVKYSQVGELGDQGNFTRNQMMLWTFVAIVVYAATVLEFIRTQDYYGSNISLPDIDGALLVLMGVTQGFYVGDKLTSQKISPTIVKLNPAQCQISDPSPELTLEITGSNFGDSPSGVIHFGATQIDGNEANNKQYFERWDDSTIKLKIPKSAISELETTGTYDVIVEVRNLKSNSAEFEVTQ